MLSQARGLLSLVFLDPRGAIIKTVLYWFVDRLAIHWHAALTCWGTRQIV